MPEALVAALDELTAAWREAMADAGVPAPSSTTILREYAGVPSLLYEAKRLSEQVGARILLKREDLNHTGAHKIRNVLGQALLTRRMGKKRVIAETGAGQHGVASATAAAYFGLDCTVYMGAVDIKRQALNVARMQLLGAKVVPVDSGSATLKDAINEALRDWVASVDHTAYLFGTAAGPHPFPSMVRDFTRGIGDEARAQCLELTGAAARRHRRLRRRRVQRHRPVHRLPRRRRRRDLRLRAGRRGRRDRPARRHDPRRGARRAARRPHLRAPGRGRPDHRVALDLGRPRLPRRRPPARPPRRVPDGRPTSPVTDAEAMDAMALLSRTEGIIPAIESAHAVAGALRGGPRPRPRRRAAGQPQRPRRQGHGDRDRRGSTWAPESSDVSASVAFDEARAEGRAALVGYLPAGFPDVAGGIAALRTLVEAGCDVIEVGLPYSDPVMDGPTIQAAAQQALDGGVRTRDVLATVEAVAATGTPTLVMTYWNPIERYGVERFAADLASAGGAGLITPDLTPDVAAEWMAAADEHGPRQGLPGRARRPPTSGSR